jgi:hypothetical protein
MVMSDVMHLHVVRRRLPRKLNFLARSPEMEYQISNLSRYVGKSWARRTEAVEYTPENMAEWKVEIQYVSR